MALFAVVDGMGGQRGGQEASRHVAQFFLEHPGLEVRQLLDHANRSVYERSAQDPALWRMGATVAGVLLQQDKVTVFNVGDSRVYHFADGYLMLATKDDRRTPESTVVTQSLGGTDRLTGISPHITELRLESTHRILICTDGLTEVVSFDAIQAILGEGSEREAAGALLNEALMAGGPDNISIIVLGRAADD